MWLPRQRGILGQTPVQPSNNARPCSAWRVRAQSNPTARQQKAQVPDSFAAPEKRGECADVYPGFEAEDEDGEGLFPKRQPGSFPVIRPRTHVASGLSAISDTLPGDLRLDTPATPVEPGQWFDPLRDGPLRYLGYANECGCGAYETAAGVPFLPRNTHSCLSCPLPASGLSNRFSLDLGCNSWPCLLRLEMCAPAAKLLPPGCRSGESHFPMLLPSPMSWWTHMTRAIWPCCKPAKSCQEGTARWMYPGARCCKARLYSSSSNGPAGLPMELSGLLHACKTFLQRMKALSAACK